MHPHCRAKPLEPAVVEELTAAGTDVHTALSIQHLGSLHDPIAQITGTRTWSGPQGYVAHGFSC